MESFFFLIFFSICLFKISISTLLQIQTFNLEFRKPSYVDGGSSVFVNHCYVSSIFIVFTRFHSSNVYLSLLGRIELGIEYICFSFVFIGLLVNCARPHFYYTSLLCLAVMVSRYIFSSNYNHKFPTIRNYLRSTVCCAHFPSNSMFGEWADFCLSNVLYSSHKYITLEATISFIGLTTKWCCLLYVKDHT